MNPTRYRFRIAVMVGLIGRGINDGQWEKALDTAVKCVRDMLLTPSQKFSEPYFRALANDVREGRRNENGERVGDYP